ncbi:hypothetical protein DPMN_063566, partial [Dreissena polymorpha]
MIFDFSCETCQGNDRNTEAEFYCEECSQFYCTKCVKHHNYLYKKHAMLGKKNISQWPVTSVDGREKCQDHKKEKLTGFCEDHTDKVKDLHQKGDFKQLSVTVDTQN